MRTLTLRIENHTTLENGGPVSLALAGRGAQIGRKVGNDWVLPDTSRHISGHHLDIGFENNQYILTDLSSNGTFLYGERYRLEGAHVIQDGDRFTIGHYIVRAILEAGTPEVAPPVAAPQPGDEFDDVWGDMGNAATPPASSLQSPPGQLQSGQPQPPYGNVSGVQQPGYSGQNRNTGAALATPSPSFHDPGAPQAPARKSGLSVPPAFAQRQTAVPNPMPQQPMPAPQISPPPAPTQYPPLNGSEGFGIADQAGANMPPVGPPQTQGANSDAMMRGFIEGAGLGNSVQSNLPPEELGRMLGRIARHGTQEMMKMLQERAAVKLFVSNEDRTMRVATGNNPMKFMPDANQAFDALFVTPRDGYLTGADAFENALSDVRGHQGAVMAAMQPALAEMLEGLAPDDIEEATGGGLLRGGSRKAWGEYIKRWEQRATQGENGMLDAFIKSFAKHYSNALRKT